MMRVQWHSKSQKQRSFNGRLDLRPMMRKLQMKFSEKPYPGLCNATTYIDASGRVITVRCISFVHQHSKTLASFRQKRLMGIILCQPASFSSRSGKKFSSSTAQSAAYSVPISALYSSGSSDLSCWGLTFGKSSGLTNTTYFYIN